MCKEVADSVSSKAYNCIIALINVREKSAFAVLKQNRNMQNIHIKKDKVNQMSATVNASLKFLLIVRE